MQKIWFSFHYQMYSDAWFYLLWAHLQFIIFLLFYSISFTDNAHMSFPLYFFIYASFYHLLDLLILTFKCISSEVILTLGSSRTVLEFLCAAKEKKRSFRVLVAEGAPRFVHGLIFVCCKAETIFGRSNIDYLNLSHPFCFSVLCFWFTTW